MANRRKKKPWTKKDREAYVNEPLTAEERKWAESAPALDTLETQLRSRLHQLTVEQADLSRRLRNIKSERLQLEALLPVIGPLAAYQTGICIDQEALAGVASFVDALLNPKKK